jgi:hypothetical protein
MLFGLALAVLGLSLVPATAADSNFSDANWSSMGGFPGANGGVGAAVVDGSGNLYIGGDFTLVGDVIANGIAKWDETNWSALGTVQGTYVSALVVIGSDLYAAGYITNVAGIKAHIAKWDGTTWSALDPGFFVSALAVSGTDLYAGGQAGSGFAGDEVVNHIAKWNGSNWTELGSWIDRTSRTRVSALAVSGGDLYVGGRFTMAGGVGATNVARWNGSRWSALGSGLRNDGDFWGVVEALAVSGGDLYASGTFMTTGGVAATNIAKWNGSRWSALGSGVNGTVSSLAASGSDLYVGGSFTNAGAIAADYIAKWDGTNWSALGSWINGAVGRLTVFGSNIYAVAYDGFTTASGSTGRIAKWDGSGWTGLGPLRSGVYGDVWSFAVAGSNLYAGGGFTSAGGTVVTNIAKWNGSSWTALGSGINGTVYELAVSGTDLYAGGYFTNAGGGAANNLAKWNGNNWSALGSGVNGDVRALTVSGSDVYAGGYFTTAGGSPAKYIAKWNGSSWSALGSGLSGDPAYEASVYALAVSGSDVYAGGNFTNAGGIAAKYIAKWNGTNWSALASGLSATVSALAVSGSDLYVGGSFTNAGGIAADYIAKWDGSSWSPLGSGLGGEVLALALSGSNVYAGGYFTTERGHVANYVAKWDGSSWTPLGSGIGSDPGTQPYVNALAVSGSDLYVGGLFSLAGGKVSGNIARAYLLDLPMLSVRRSGTDVMVSWPSTDTTGFGLEQAGALRAPGGWVANTATVTDDGVKKSVTLPAMNSPRFFRLRRP